uniref:NrS-1 polymerase-like helicase domain-containing protein n=1 Tax=Faecalibacterium prausnitzii TaxID=853 RepID=A0A564UHI2_9FIRM|nr:Uncharacterised protein [Faecalibacterium prausnitzii]
MSLYQKIKSAITVRQVGEMYGMEPDRHGMVCCPFHSDSDPSMKLNDTYYYCLIPSTKGQKMMLIVGKGGEGKSRIGLVLKRLMGDAASNGSVQKVENNRFARADLERRLLMIDDDMDMNALPKTNYADLK